MIYLGQPYSHPDPAIRQLRYEQGMALCAELARAGKVVYAPIVHWHEIARLHNLPTDYEFWKKICLSILGRSTQLLVAKLSGWELSVGLADERKFAREMGIPINYIKGDLR
jgi:hypothetical protein